MRAVRAARFLGSVVCKTGGGAGCFRFVGGARSRTIILSKLRWRNRVDLNRDHRFTKDTEMPNSVTIVFKRNDAVARLAVCLYRLTVAMS